MEDSMYYTIYKVTNKINGKFYIGSHKTKDLDDNYMGSGKYLKRAQEKHGLENFTKEILFVFDNPEEMYAKEAEIVNEDFLSEENTYNLKKGGHGGFDYVNSNIDFYKRNRKINSRKDYDALKASGYFKKLSKIGTDVFKNKMKENDNKAWWQSTRFYGKTHTEETKRKIGEANSKLQSGKGNSQYGTRWIHSLEEKVSKRIKKEDPLPKGWLEGRKIKF